MVKRRVYAAVARCGASIDDYFGFRVDGEPCFRFDAYEAIGVADGRKLRAGVDIAALQPEIDAIGRAVLAEVFADGAEVLVVTIDGSDAPPGPHASEEICAYDWLGPLGSPSTYTYAQMVLGTPAVEAWLAGRHNNGYFMHPDEPTLVRVDRWGSRVHAQRPGLAAAIERRLAPMIAAARSRFAGS